LVEYDKVMFFSEDSAIFRSKDKEKEGVMRSVYATIFAGCISFAGFYVHAQPGGAGDSFDLDRVIESLAAGGATGINTERVIAEVTSDVMGTSTSTGQQTSAIEGNLVVYHAEPAINLIEIIDTRMERYLPKLKINFAEFPLRSLTEVNRPNNGRSAQTGMPIELLAQRIQNRLSVPAFNLAIEDRTAIISGTVATERERELIERWLHFEPGISTVRNEITVVP